MSTTAKVSVTLSRADLQGAKRLAARLGTSLSSFITEAVRRRIEEQARREAAETVVAGFPSEDRASPEEMQSLLATWAPSVGEHPRTKRKRRPARRG
ncbi:MAG: hypothetical protein IT377_25690 [Polyangiaceae bacterium]|nr:hypothetical protein [Polyangiaceae bacterium]